MAGLITKGVLQKPMAIIDKMAQDNILAMKRGAKENHRALSYFISVAKKVEKDGGDETKIIAALQKEKKAIEENIRLARNDREKGKFLIEFNLLTQYLPAQMSEGEIRSILMQYTGERNKGKMMKYIMPLVKGKADGKLVQQIVDEVLL